MGWGCTFKEGIRITYIISHALPLSDLLDPTTDFSGILLGEVIIFPVYDTI